MVKTTKVIWVEAIYKSAFFDTNDEDTITDMIYNDETSDFEIIDYHTVETIEIIDETIPPEVWIRCQETINKLNKEREENDRNV